MSRGLLLGLVACSAAPHPTPPPPHVAVADAAPPHAVDCDGTPAPSAALVARVESHRP